MSTTAIVILVVAAVLLLIAVSYLAGRPKRRQLKEQRERAASRQPAIASERDVTFEAGDGRFARRTEFENDLESRRARTY
jgi:hypothetical protein